MSHANRNAAQLAEGAAPDLPSGKAAGLRSTALSVAPMMAWTDRHCRFFHRQFTRRTLLYTEMVTAPALARGGALHLLEKSEEEHPVALQLGGADPTELAIATRLGAEHGYTEINLNVGCPSDRVKSGAFGAVLMKDPVRVGECLSAMAEASKVPVSVKCRIGVDDQESNEVLPDFLDKVSAAGVSLVTIHARKAWLKGLSPKENREIPPLDYALVARMSEDFPELSIAINGGLESLDDARSAMGGDIHGAMIGRAAYHRPADILTDADQAFFGAPNPVNTPGDVLDRMEPYIAEHLAAGGSLHQVTRHMLGLFTGKPGARIWRRILSEGATRADAGLPLLREARGAVEAQSRQAA